MDPFAAFCLACGIIQVVDFSTKVVKKCHELYKDGVSSENKEIEEMAKHLTELRNDLDLIDQDGADEILDLGSKCSGTARELVIELERLKVKGPHRKRQVARKTLKIIFKESPIDRIQNRFNEYQKQLDSRILVDLRKRCHLTAVQQNKKFRDLDLKVHAIILELTESPRSFDELKVLIEFESLSIKGHTTHELQQHRRHLDQEQYRLRVLESLCYPEINRRQETVGEAHQKTFQWVFESYGFNSSPRLWNSIVQWFGKGDGVYWISGKAGSGKSTLMNYIYQDSRTLNLLRVWSGTKELFTPSFFFWNAGTALEKSTEGLLRSLLYQLLRRFPALTPLPYDEQSTLNLAEDYQKTYGRILAWTERRLRTTFYKVVRQAQTKCRLCIFIDGLDEINGEPAGLLEVIQKMLSAELKVCLSSRPDRLYADAFESRPMLRLQDLTKSDIRTYSRDGLKTSLRKLSEEDAFILIDCIAQRAQGVFLWAELVVKAFVKGLTNDDSVKQLHARLDTIPSDIEALYAKMLNDIDIVYREEAVELFRMALEGLSGSLLNVTLAMCNAFNRRSEMSIQEFIHLSRRTQQRIPTICAGLLEVYPSQRDPERSRVQIKRSETFLTLPHRYASSEERAAISFYERCVHVIFIHRTARDFLLQSKEGQLFLEQDAISCPSIHSTYVRGLLAKVDLLGLPDRSANTVSDFNTGAAFPELFYAEDQFDDYVDMVACLFVSEIMKSVSWEEWRTGTAQTSLCDDVDHTLMTVYKRDPVSSPLLHWSARWGSRHHLCESSTGDTWWFQRSSRSSSPESFRSTRSEPTRFSGRPLDFLGFAASWGLYFYVLETLNLHQKHLDKEYASYLVCCSVGRLNSMLNSWRYRLFSREGGSAILNLVTELLSRGGNPNIYVGNPPTSVWRLFLGGLPSAINSDPKALSRTVKEFLQKGADVHTKVAYIIRVYTSEEDEAAYMSAEGAEMYFRHERSALYIVRTWMKRVPNSKCVEDIILANGGDDSQSFTHVAFRIENYRPHKLSQKQQNRLIATLNEADCGYLEEGLETASLVARVKWAQQLGATYKKILESSPESESSVGSVASVERDSSEGEAEEQFFDSLDTWTVEDVQEDPPEVVQ